LYGATGLAKRGDYEYIEKAECRHPGKTVQDEYLITMVTAKGLIWQTET
jgi:hypothetical protein